MLLVQQPYLISHLQRAYETSKAIFFADENVFYALSTVFENMLLDPLLSPAYLIVDALDECDETKPGVNELIGLIYTSLKTSMKVRWLISSRPSIDLLCRTPKN
jgi:hypothetical protein